METNFTLKKSRVISIDFNVEELRELKDPNFEFTFELGINDKNPELAKIDGTLEVKNFDEIDNFLFIKFIGIFEGINENPDLKFEEMEKSDVKKMLNMLINELSPVVKQIFFNSFNIPIDLKKSLKLD